MILLYSKKILRLAPLKDTNVNSNPTWWLIPVSKWVMIPFTSGLTLLSLLITGAITEPLTILSHQAKSRDELKLFDLLSHSKSPGTYPLVI